MLKFTRKGKPYCYIPTPVIHASSLPFKVGNSIYLGKSKRHYLVRVFEHLGVSLATGKHYTYNSKNNNNTAVLNHINKDTCNATLDNFRIIGNARNDYSLCLKESLMIQLHKYNLNNNVKSSGGSTVVMWC